MAHITRTEPPFPYEYWRREVAGKRKRVMAVKTLDATVADFDHVFAGFRSEHHPTKLLLFLADVDPATSLSWCPDCVRAEPVIYKKLEASSKDIVLLRAYVGDRATYRNPSHPFRNDKRFKLKGVPTLIRWENDTIAGRLEDYEAHIEAKIDSLIADK